MALLAYLGFLVLIPLLTDAKKEMFVKFHVKQGLGLFIYWVLLWLVRRLLPFFLGWPIWWIGTALGFVLIIMGVINVVNGDKKPLPLIGNLSRQTFTF